MSDCPKWWNGNKTSSMMHIAQLFSFDASSLKLGNRFEPTSIPKPKRFDSMTYGYLKQTEHQAHHGNKTDCLSKCPVCTAYPNTTSQTEEFSPEELMYANRIHEAYESQTEFDLCRAAITDTPTELRRHLQDKTYAKEPVLKLFGIDLNPFI